MSHLVCEFCEVEHDRTGIGLHRHRCREGWARCGDLAGGSELAGRQTSRRELRRWCTACGFGDDVPNSYVSLGTGSMRPHPPTRSHEHPQAATHPCLRVQSRPAAAHALRCGDAAWSPGLRRSRGRRSFRPDPHCPSTAYGQSRQRALNSGVAPFELPVFAVTLCRHRNRNLYDGLLSAVTSPARACRSSEAPTAPLP